MKTFLRAVVVVVIVALWAGGALAQGRLEWASLQEVQRRPLPGPALLAATSNLIYAPIRFGLTAVEAEFGGLTGLLTGGNEHAFDDVSRLTRGQAILTPAIVQGIEPLRFGDYEFRMRMIPPRR